LPTVGAIIEGEMLKANIAYPGLTIEYQTHGKNTETQGWQLYSKPVKVNSAVKIRSRSVNALRTGRITTVPLH